MTLLDASSAAQDTRRAITPLDVQPNERLPQTSR